MTFLAERIVRSKGTNDMKCRVVRNNVGKVFKNLVHAATEIRLLQFLVILRHVHSQERVLEFL